MHGGLLERIGTSMSSLIIIRVESCYAWANREDAAIRSSNLAGQPYPSSSSRLLLRMMRHAEALGPFYNLEMQHSWQFTSSVTC